MNQILKYKIKIEYDGTSFVGWQFQKNGLSIQEVLQRAIFNFSKEKVILTGAGRTDSGVHASKFFAHFETNQNFDTESLLFKVNCIISFEIALYKIYKVDSEMHARFSANSRTYHYFINPNKDPFYFKTSWFMHQDLDLVKMNQAKT